MNSELITIARPALPIPVPAARPSDRKAGRPSAASEVLSASQAGSSCAAAEVLSATVNRITVNRITAHRITAHRITAHRITAHRITAHRITARRITVSYFTPTEISVKSVTPGWTGFFYWNTRVLNQLQPKSRMARFTYYVIFSLILFRRQNEIMEINEQPRDGPCEAALTEDQRVSLHKHLLSRAQCGRSPGESRPMASRAGAKPS
jgi:hypothetical protein